MGGVRGTRFGPEAILHLAAELSAIRGFHEGSECLFHLIDATLRSFEAQLKALS